MSGKRKPKRVLLTSFGSASAARTMCAHDIGTRHDRDPDEVKAVPSSALGLRYAQVIPLFVEAIGVATSVAGGGRRRQTLPKDVCKFVAEYACNNPLSALCQSRRVGS